MSTSTKRMATAFGSLAAATLATVALAAPAHAADRTIQLTSPSGAVHSVLSWDDSVDTLCLTLRSGAAGAYADADMRLVGGGSAQYLHVSASRPRHCTGNLSIAEDRLAEMRLYGGANTFHSSTGWVQFYT
ncbi:MULTISPECIES: hypothetical protein [unclassified Knoellia]|uniref:hypothetical protein n=1 Tax=Knoellia altitudinis TaxID=3404795 RepID=UPI0036078193